jgi:hypothetical protein
MDKQRFEIQNVRIYLHRSRFGHVEVHRTNGRGQFRLNEYSIWQDNLPRLARAQAMQTALAKATQGEIE